MRHQDAGQLEADSVEGSLERSQERSRKRNLERSQERSGMGPLGRAGVAQSGLRGPLLAPAPLRALVRAGAVKLRRVEMDEH